MTNIEDLLKRADAHKDVPWHAMVTEPLVRDLAAALRDEQEYKKAYKESFMEDYLNLEKERDQLRAENAKLREAYDVREHARLVEENEGYKSRYETYDDAVRNLTKGIAAGDLAYGMAKAKLEEAERENVRLTAQLRIFQANEDALTESWQHELDEAEKLLDETASLARIWAARKEALVYEVPPGGKELLLSQSRSLQAFADELERRQGDRISARKEGKP